MTAAAVSPGDKEGLRRLLTSSPEHLNLVAGRLAETLRRDQHYRGAETVYVEPHPCLRQIRINTLIDGKKLLMPTAGIKEGFTLTTPFSVPFPSLNWAVTLKGQADYGRNLALSDLGGLGVGMLVAADGYIDPAGVWLGGGNGFLDLAWAILTQARALAPDAVLYGVAAARLLEKLAPSPWDVRINAEISVDRIRPLTTEQTAGEILWQSLPPKRIRKITPLWQLHRL